MRRIATCVAAALLIAPPARAQTVEEFYQGKALTVIVGNGPGGGFDVYARLLARHIGQYVPGHPSVVVQNMPGAGSLVAANYIYNVAPRDGTVFGAVNAMLATDPLLYPERVKFDPRRFRWLGSALRENHAGFAWHTTGVTKFDDVLKDELIVPGTGGATNFYPMFVDALLGAKLR